MRFVYCVIDDVCSISFMLFFFFFKQKTAYEMRISDWSSDVCSSDLLWSPSIVARCHEAALIALRAGRFAMAPVRIGILAGHKHAHRPDATCAIAPAGGQIAEHDDVARHRAQKLSTQGRSSTSQLQDRKRTRLNSSH